MKESSRKTDLWSTFGPFKRLAIALFFIIIISALSEALGLGMILPLLQIVLDPQSDFSGTGRYLIPMINFFPKQFHLLFVCGLTILLIIVKNIFVLLQTYYSNRLMTNLRRYWSSGVMESYMFSQFSSLVNEKQGVLMNNIVQEPNYASKALRDVIDFFAKLIFSIFILALLFAVNWLITLVVCFLSALIVLLLHRLTHTYALNVGKRKIRLNQQINAVAAEGIAGVRQIKTFSMENRVVRDFVDRLDSLLGLILRFNVINKLPGVLGEIVFAVLILGGFLFYYYLKSLSITNILPVMALFLICAQRLFSNFTLLLSERMSLISYVPSLKLVDDLVKNKMVREEMKSGEPIESPKAEIRFRDVSFSYMDGKTVLERLNLTLRKGLITAIAGPSGAGKSTICDLLIGLFKPSSGEIYIDGKNINDLNIHSWRNLIGYISQEPFLFNASIRDNVLVGKPDASQEEVTSAALLTGMHEFIQTLPEKYDAMLGDRGVTLSGGQRQRIAIARALIRNPEIIILDEATSSLDSESERQIEASLKHFFGEKIIILITHRLSSLRIADWIYVIDNGSIIESGRYEELIGNKGLFWKLEQISRERQIDQYRTNQT